MHLPATTTLLLATTASTFFGLALAGAYPHGNGNGNVELNAAGVLLPRQQGGRFSLQTFTGALGGAPASPIVKSDDPERPFEVDGDTFNDFEAAANRACDNQKNVCADLANNGTGNFKVGDCDQQNERCKAAALSATVREFPPPVLVSSNAEFDFFCDP